MLKPLMILKSRDATDSYFRADKIIILFIFSKWSAIQFSMSAVIYVA